MVSSIAPRSRSSNQHRTFLEVMLALVILLLISWSPEKGAPPPAPDDLSQKTNSKKGGATVKMGYLQLTHSGLWLEGVPIDSEIALNQLSAKGISTLYLEPAPQMSWQAVSETWEQAIKHGFDVTLVKP